MAAMQSLDPHQRPPNSIRDVYKKYQRMKARDLEQEPEIVHLERDLDQDLEPGHLGKRLPRSHDTKVSIVNELEPEQLTATFRAFAGSYTDHESVKSVPVYEHKDMPGTFFYFTSCLQ